MVKPEGTNPARRLHTLLERYHTVSEEDRGATLFARWGKVFGVESDTVLPMYVSAFGLIGSVQQAVEIADIEDLTQSFWFHRDSWVAAFAPRQSGTSQAVKDGSIPQGDLLALGLIATGLQNMPDGLLPAEDEVRSLRDQVEHLITEARDDDRLPLEMRDLMVRRLHDLLWALDHVEIVGPDAIRAACERIAVAMVWAMDTDSKNGCVPHSKFFEKLHKILQKGLKITVYPGGVYGSYQALDVLEPIVDSAQKVLGGG